MPAEITDTTGEKVFLTDKILRNNIRLRSEGAQEIISRKPDFTEKWALFIFMGILLLLLSATWFIRYPDIIDARATLTASNAPKEIVIRQEGRLVKLFVRNDEKVSRNEMIGWIESTADHEDVLELSRQLDSSINLLSGGQPQKVSVLFKRHWNNLGEIQQGYREFITALQLFNDYMINGFYLRKKHMLQNDISSIEKTRRTIEDQKTLTERDLKLAEESYNIHKTLFDKKALTREEFRVEESKFVNKQMAIPQFEASLLSNESQLRVKLGELDQLNHDIAQQQLVFQQALQSLKSSVDDWKKRYIIQSPLDGKITFTVPLQENQFLQHGRLVGYTNPDDSHFYAETNLPQNNFGKIDTGLKVQLRFDAYPYQEVGFVNGTLNYVSNIASDSGFLATIKLDDGLVTNNNKKISYKSGLKAQAIVITKDMRVLERLYYNMVQSASLKHK